MQQQGLIVAEAVDAVAVEVEGPKEVQDAVAVEQASSLQQESQ